jgi:uncharacterized protein YutE (UPF0331/DUF86 family)
MSPGKLNSRILADRIAWIARMLEEVRKLPLDDYEHFRNRLVHFYHEIETEELYKICKDDLHDVHDVREAFLAWIKDNPGLIDKAL